MPVHAGPVEYSGIDYYLLTQNTYLGAVDDAADTDNIPGNGKLVTIIDETHNIWLWDTFLAEVMDRTVCAWIGAHYDGAWRWHKDDALITYDAWAPAAPGPAPAGGEPNRGDDFCGDPNTVETSGLMLCLQGNGTTFPIGAWNDYDPTKDICWYTTWFLDGIHPSIEVNTTCDPDYVAGRRYGGETGFEIWALAGDY